MNYILVNPVHDSGICGYIWQFLRTVYENPDKKYYIDFSNSIYQSNRGQENVWDWFFEQPHFEKQPLDLEVEKTTRVPSHPNSEYVEPFIISNNPHEEYNLRRKKYNEIIEKYLKPKPHIQKLIDDFYTLNMRGIRVLGAHFRGTDHPYKLSMDYYIPIIQEKLKTYDKIFICSDEAARFEHAKREFGDKCIFYKSNRSNTDSPLHSPYFRRSNEYQYKIAEDVIVEAYLLSKTDYLFCCHGSNVNFLSRAINSKLDYVML
jgi:hypothetical protein